MVYPINLLKSTAECDQLIQEINVEKGRVTLRLDALKHQRMLSERDVRDPRLEIEFCIDQIATHEAHLATLPSGAARAETELALLRWQMRMKTLERQIRINGPTAKCLDELEINRLERESDVIHAFIDQVTAQRELLERTNLAANTDLGKVA